MKWLAGSSLAPQSQFIVDAMPHLCIVEQKRPTPVLSQLSVTQAGLGSIVFVDLS